MQPRGLRNCNPGNIRIAHVRYKGEITPSQDPAFKQFQTMAWGYRAIFVLLASYWRKGFRTIRQMIARYAPPSENDTDSYLRTVSRTTGIDPDQPIDPQNRDTMVPVAAAISRVENGIAAVMADVEEGWRLFQRYRP